MKKIIISVLSFALLTTFKVNSTLKTTASSKTITTKADASYLSDYYSSINSTMTGTTLLAKLETKIKADRQASFSYSSLFESAFIHTDVNPLSPDDGNIISFYSGTPAKASAMNREHVWPNSHGGGKIDNDPHMPRPTIVSENSSRGNRYFGDSGGSWDPASFNNEKYRGIAARIIFYGAVAGNASGLILEDVDRGQDSGTTNKMGKLSTLLKWNLQYPVDQTEIIRNETLDRSLGWNRNPFIDDPLYACRIWGETTSATIEACASAVTPPVEKVTVTPSVASVRVGETLQLQTSVLPATALQSVRYTTSNEQIASISSSGLITGNSIGTVSITVTSTSDSTKKSGATIQVTNDPINVESISFDSTSKSLAIGKTLTLSPLFTPSNTTDKRLNWASSNASVATVSTSGVVSAISEGLTSITATTVEGGASSSINIEVTAQQPVSRVMGNFYNNSTTSDGNTIENGVSDLNNGVTGDKGYLGFGGVNVISSMTYTQMYLPRSGGFALGSKNNSGFVKFTLNSDYETKYIEVLANAAGISGTTLSLSGTDGRETKGSLGTENSNPGTGQPYILEFDNPTNIFMITASKRTAIVEINIYIEDVSNPISDATSWAKSFLDLTAEGCLLSDQVLLANQWGITKTAYSALSLDAQNTIKESTFNVLGNDIEQALARYRYLLNKYYFEDYVNFYTSSMNMNEKDQLIEVIIIASGVIFSLATLIYVGYKKRIIK